MCCPYVANYFCRLPEVDILYSTPMGCFTKGEPGCREWGQLVRYFTVSVWQDVFWDPGSKLNAIATLPMMRKTPCTHLA